VTAPTLPATRQRWQLVAAGALLAAALVATDVGLWLLSSRSLPASVVAGSAVALVLVGAAVGSAGRARREAGQVVAAAAALAALGAAGLVFLAAAVLVLGRRPDDDEKSLLPATLAAALAAALAFGPLRSRVRSAVRGTVFAHSRTPDAALEAFGDRAAAGVPTEELLRQLAEALRSSYGLTGVEVWTRDPDVPGGLLRLLSLPHRAAPLSRLTADDADTLRRSGVAGDSWLRLWLPRLLEGRGDAQVRVAPAGHGAELLAVVVVERAPDGERFRASEERALGEISRRLGVVLHNRALDAALQTTLDDLRRTNDELRASRSRLVSAADSERRRIERDIHDGAQQHLAALAVNLGLARQLLGDGSRPPDDAATVAALLEEMQADVRETIAQVRDLAHGIYPPLLRQAGLPEALRAAATRSPNAVAVTVEGVDGRHGADVEAALYFCALEALQNIAKHAPAAAATVRLTGTDGLLVLEVEDDGPGYDPAGATAGQGRQNMTDRVGAVGGSLRVDSQGGRGTLVRAEVPVPVRAG
jgi:signal transduction histidine kinase